MSQRAQLSLEKKDQEKSLTKDEDYARPVRNSTIRIPVERPSGGYDYVVMKVELFGSRTRHISANGRQSCLDGESRLAPDKTPDMMMRTQHRPSTLPSGTKTAEVLSCTETSRRKKLRTAESCGLETRDMTDARPVGADVRITLILGR
ncbi:hypothetical protein Bbelb_136450 [Branchiostoma belcheri]|nr:hypothetical protein Bbelb_136450 [Branchiostoma belcheri]